MLSRWLPLVLGLASGLALPASLAAQEAPWALAPEMEGWALEVFTTRNGLPQNTINQMVQTRDGYVWFATFGGLARFDGLEFHTLDLTSHPALPEVRVTSLMEDRDGALWVGFQEGHLGRLSEGRYHPVPGAAGTVGVVWQIAQDREGRIWVSTDRGPGMVGPAGDFRPVGAVQTGGRRVGTRGVVAADAGAWFWMYDRQLRLFDGQGRMVREVPAPPWVGPVTSVGAGEDGTLLLAGPLGLTRFLPEEGGWVPVTREGRPGTTFQGPREELWVVGEGVRRLEPGGSAQLLLPPGTVAIQGGMVDREGGVWLGTAGAGALRLRRTPLRRLDRADGLQRGGVVAAVPGVDGEVWLVQCNQVTRVAADLTLSIYPTANAEACLSRLAVFPDSSVWVSGPSQLWRLEEGGVFAAPLPDPQTAPVVPFTGPEGRLWILQGPRLHSWDGTGWQAMGRIALDAGERPLSEMLVTPEGDLLLGTTQGLIRWSGGRTERLGAGRGLAPGGIRALILDGGDGIWAGSYGGGLSHVASDGTVRTLTTRDGLVENVVAGMALDLRGRLWISGNRSLSVIRLAALRDRLAGSPVLLQPLAFGPADGFMEGNGSSTALDAQGLLWFPAINGVVRVDQGWEAPEQGAPPALVESVLADGEPVDLSVARVPSRVRELLIHYSAPRFTRPGNTSFRYRLRGLDEEWTYAGSRREAVFSRVPPGRYTFQLEASSSESGARTVTSLGLEVTPALWEALWFRAAVALGVVGLLLFAVRLRLQAVTRRARELQDHAGALEREIQERSRLESERETLREQLLRSQKMEAVGRLTGGIAHDFNNLLSVIMGHLDLAAANPGDPDALDEHVTSAYKAATRGGALTRQLLAFSRRADLDPESTDLGALLAGMRPLLRPALGANARLVVEEAPGSWPCHVDRNRLENVLLNLVINARDAMPGGGTATVRLENTTLDGEAAREMELEPGDYLHLSVADTGEGIPEDHLERVLDPFFTTKEVGKGTGLGLSMAYGFARQSGGHLRIESVVGEGTTIHLYLPRSGTAPAAEGRGRAHLSTGQGERVLVLEDEEGVRAVTVKTLHELGYRTAEAGSVSAARDVLLNFGDVEVVLSDVVMPGESGTAFRQELARTRPDLPVILMSGRPPEDGETVEFLQKPFSREELGRRIRAVLERASPA